MSKGVLKDYLIGQVMSFTAGDGDEVVQDYNQGLEVTDTSDGEIEFAFDLKGPKRRVYVRMKINELADILDDAE